MCQTNQHINDINTHFHLFVPGRGLFFTIFKTPFYDSFNVAYKGPFSPNDLLNISCFHVIRSWIISAAQANINCHFSPPPEMLRTWNTQVGVLFKSCSIIQQVHSVCFASRGPNQARHVHQNMTSSIPDQSTLLETPGNSQIPADKFGPLTK